MKKIFLAIFTVLILAWGGFQYWPVTVHINGVTREENFSIQMPLKDKKRLEYFFRDVCLLNAWAYTLMGSKPMSIHQYRKPWAAVRYILFHPEIKDILRVCFWPPDIHEICHLFNPEQLKIMQGCDTLNKYIHYFPSTRYMLCKFSSENNEIVVLAVINKVQFTKTISQYPEDFQKLFQAQGIKPEDLFKDDKLYTFVRGINTDGLIGTVLGFGRNNAYLFEKYRSLRMAPELRPMTGIWEEEEVEHSERTCKKARSFQPWDISDLFYPPFACDPNSEETKQLKQTYKREREEIVKYYEGKDVVEATLSLFNQK